MLPRRPIRQRAVPSESTGLALAGEMAVCCRARGGGSSTMHIHQCWTAHVPGYDVGVDDLLVSEQQSLALACCIWLLQGGEGSLQILSALGLRGLGRCAVLVANGTVNCEVGLIHGTVRDAPCSSNAPSNS